MKPPVFADPQSLPGIVLHQPYAGLVRAAALGFDGKSIETRKNRVHYRGPLVIVAGKGTDFKAAGTVAHRARTRGLVGSFGWMALEGVAVALFHVAGCRPLVPEDEPRSWFFEKGRHAWMPDRVQPLRPFHVRGMPGFVRVPRAQVLAALEGPGFLFCPRCGRRHGSAAVVDTSPGPTSMSCSPGASGGGCGHAWTVGGAAPQGQLFEGAPR